MVFVERCISYLVMHKKVNAAVAEFKIFEEHLLGCDKCSRLFIWGLFPTKLCKVGSILWVNFEDIELSSSPIEKYFIRRNTLGRFNYGT